MTKTEIETPTSAPPKKKRNPHAVQTAVLGSLKNQRVSIRLLDGTEIGGTLRAADVYTLALQPDGAECVDLLYKHGVSTVRPAPTEEAPQ